MKSPIIKSLLFTTFTMLLLVACTPSSIVKYPIHTPDTKDVVFRNITSHKVNNGIKVSGSVQKRTTSYRRIKIHGHIHVIFKNQKGTVLETTTANVHRKFGNSRSWHFDAVLKSEPPKGAKIVVEHHHKH